MRRVHGLAFGVVIIILAGVQLLALRQAPVSAPIGDPPPDPVTMSATRAWPVGLGDALLAPSRVAVDESSWAAVRVGVLNDTRGNVVVLAHDATALTTDRAPIAGLFQGATDRSGPEGPAPFTALELWARDWILWAALVSVAGILLALRLEAWFSRDAPRGLLNVRLAALRERSLEFTVAEAIALASMPTWVGVNKQPTRLVNHDGTAGVLPPLFRQALDDFDAQPTIELRESRWGRGGGEFAKLQTEVDSQQWHADSGQELNRNLLDARSQLGPGRYETFDASPAAVAVRVDLSGGLIETPEDWTSRRDARASLREQVRALKAVADANARIRELDLNAKERQTLDTLNDRLAAAPSLDRKYIEDVADDARALYKGVLGRQGGSLDALDESEDDVFGLLNSLSYTDTGGGWLDEPIHGSASEIAASLRRINDVYLAVAAAVVLVTVLGTQYLANPIYGTPGDYAATFAWAFAAAAVAQLAKWLAFARSVGDGRLPPAVARRPLGEEEI